MPANPTPDLPQWNPGDGLSAELFNRFSDAIRMMRVSVEGMDSSVGPGGTTIRAADPRTLRWAKTRTGGVTRRMGPNLGQGSVDLYYNKDGVLTKIGTVATVFNFAGGSTDVVANVWCIVGKVDGQYALIAADCSGPDTSEDA